MCFFGVFYHLKYPILAFERIANILNKNGYVFAVGSGFGHYLETIEGNPIPSSELEKYRELLDEMDKKRIPLTLSYPGTFKKGNNWFLPNKTALEAWMIAAGFEVLHISGFINQEGILSL